MKKFTINKGLITQKTGDKLTIFDTEESILYTLNETASYIFSKLKLGWEKKRIIDNLVLKYQQFSLHNRSFKKARPSSTVK